MLVLSRRDLRKIASFRMMVVLLPSSEVKRKSDSKGSGASLPKDLSDTAAE